jgi:hypothetical protein
MFVLTDPPDTNEMKSLAPQTPTKQGTMDETCCSRYFYISQESKALSSLAKERLWQTCEVANRNFGGVLASGRFEWGGYLS